MHNLFKTTAGRTQKAPHGFSLIEVLVSLSLFTIVMTICIGVLMVLIEANGRSQNTQAVMTNITFALDSITREIRTGTDYYCGNWASGSFPTSSGSDTRDCEDGLALSFNEGGNSLTEGASSRRIALRLADGALQRRLGNGDGDSNVNEAADWSPLTSPNIRITELRLYVTGATRGDLESPTVTLYVEGIADEGEVEETTFNIQTSVVQQLLDI